MSGNWLGVIILGACAALVAAGVVLWFVGSRLPHPDEIDDWFDR